MTRLRYDALLATDSHGSEIEAESLNEDGGMTLPKVLRWFWIGSLVAFGLMLLVNYLEYLAGFPWNARFPLGDTLFGDLLEFVPASQSAHMAESFRATASSMVAYPPFGAVLYSVMYSFGHPVEFYLGIFALWLGVAIGGIRRLLITLGIRPITAVLFPLTLAAVSFPIEGLLQRGNIELFVWIFAAAGTWAFLRDRDKTAAVLWGLAASIKLFPIILLVLFVAKPRFRALLLGLTTFVISSVLSMVYLGPSVKLAFERSLRNVFGYQTNRASELSVHEFAANHSAFIPIRFLAMTMGRPSVNVTNLYYLFGGLLFVAVFFGKVRKMPVANQVLAVTTFMVLMPQVSYFYTLVHLYVPFLMLMVLAIRAERQGVRIEGLRSAILLFVPIFASFSIFTYPRVYLFGGLIQGLMLMILFLCALQYPFALPPGGEKTGAETEVAVQTLEQRLASARALGRA
jgi:Glycosyltransferase family 87